MSTPSPVVSVIIPAYDAAAYIEATLDSAFGQTFTDYEVIVVNDGSTDTAELEQVLRRYRDRIVYLTQANGGPSKARNAGIRHARGAYVALLDSDDVWMPEYLAEQMRLLTADPSIDLLYSNGIVFGDSPLAGRMLMDRSPSSGSVTFERLIDERCTVLTSCTVLKRRALLNVDLFDERFRRSEDYHLWLRLAFHGHRLSYHRKPLVRHRRRQGSLSRDRLAMTNAIIDVLEDVGRTLPLTARQQARVHRQIARRRAQIALEEGRRLFVAEQYDAAAAALDRSVRSEPGRLRQTRLRAVRLGLRFTPRLLRRLYDVLRQPAASTAANPMS